jgi:hypothetical protein
MPENPTSQSPRTEVHRPVARDAIAPVESRAAPPAEQFEPGETVQRLESLRRRSDFNAFVNAALDSPTDSAAISLLKTEALLAVGRSADAEQQAKAATELALDVVPADHDLAAQSLRRWITARFRQQKSLTNDWIETASSRFPAYDSTVKMLTFWSEALGDRSPYSTSSVDETYELPLSPKDVDSLALDAIEVRANGVSMPTVFIDTGAPNVLMTLEAAEAAGVRLGPGGLRLVGFAHTAARPGVLETLDLGGLVLHDVPVFVGDSAPLAAAGGQMALGTELMHHVRLTIDYPRRRVLAQSASAAKPAIAGHSAWDIPIWTFSQLCLAQGQLPDGASARVLVDTGNRAGTYVSTRWAHRNLPGFPRTTGPVVFRRHHRDLVLAKMELGSAALKDWPLTDTLPADLDRVDAVDILLGRDLLSDYRVTIDMSARSLRLEATRAAEGSDEVGHKPTAPHQSIANGNGHD